MKWIFLETFVLGVFLVTNLNDECCSIVQAFNPTMQKINIYHLRTEVAHELLSSSSSSSSFTTQLYATNKSNKRRRRKSPPAVPGKDPIKISQEKIEIVDGNNIMQVADDDDDDDDGDYTDEQVKMNNKDLLMLNEIARFEFQKDKEMTMGIPDDTKLSLSSSSSVADSSSSIQAAIPLPDITEARRLKQEQNELQRLEQEQVETKIRIKRTDKEAFRKVCRICINFFLNWKGGTIPSVTKI
jgi:hypothetical protein